MTLFLSKPRRITPTHGFGSKVDGGDRKRPGGKRRVRFTDTPARRHEYEFDREFKSDCWYSGAELLSFYQLVFFEADEIRRDARERGVRAIPRHGADGLSDGGRGLLVGDEVTRALDYEDDDLDISLRGIEHFVFPLLQEEMVRRVRDVKKAVLRHSLSPMMRVRDPSGLRLAEASAGRSKWSRDFAMERGMKYCEMKRGMGSGGGLLQISKAFKGQRRFSILENEKADL